MGLILTYKCQVACRHCILQAGPNRTEQITLDNALDWIDQIASYRNGWVKVVSLTGGEPFYDLPKLKEIVRFAKNKGLMVSVVSNAFWASTPENARNALIEVSAIDMLAVSADVYHQECIPLRNIANAVQTANDLGIPINIHVCSEDEFDPKHQKIIDYLKTIVNEEQIVSMVTLPVGRALEEADISKLKRAPEPPSLACSSGNTPIIFPDGKVVACIGPIIDLKASHPLVIGNLNQNTLQDLFDRAETNPILHAIRVWGPKKLISKIRETKLRNLTEQDYLSEIPCDACYKLMSDPRLVAAINDFANDPQFIQLVAYGRAYYLRETKMLELLNSEAKI